MKTCAKTVRTNPGCVFFYFGWIVCRKIVCVCVWAYWELKSMSRDRRLTYHSNRAGADDSVEKGKVVLFLAAVNGFFLQAALWEVRGEGQARLFHCWIICVRREIFSPWSRGPGLRERWRWWRGKKEVVEVVHRQLKGPKEEEEEECLN